MYDVIMTNIMYWKKNIYLECCNYFNEHISSGIEKKVNVLSEINRNFWFQLWNLKAIYYYQLQVQASQKLSSKSSKWDHILCKYKHKFGIPSVFIFRSTKLIFPIHLYHNQTWVTSKQEDQLRPWLCKFLSKHWLVKQSPWMWTATTASQTWNKRFKIRKEYHLNNNVLYLQGNNWKTIVVCQIITFKRKVHYIWYWDWEVVQCKCMWIIYGLVFYCDYYCVLVWNWFAFVLFCFFGGTMQVYVFWYFFEKVENFNLSFC